MIRLDTPEASAYREATLRKRSLEQSGPIYETLDLAVINDGDRRAALYSFRLSYTSYYLVKNAKIGETVTVKVRVT